MLLFFVCILNLSNHVPLFIQVLTQF